MKQLTLLSIVLLALGCATAAGPSAVATLSPTTGNTASGKVTLMQLASGEVDVRVELTGVPPGTHGFHIHEKGDCGDNGNAAGGHFNPHTTSHGSPVSEPHHAGDFGNVTAEADGTVNLRFKTRDISLDPGAASAIGKAFILHANPDDLVTQPTGNAGGRIACGIVEARVQP